MSFQIGKRVRIVASEVHGANGKEGIFQGEESGGFAVLLEHPPYVLRLEEVDKPIVVWASEIEEVL
jgi:hypothetical protein